MRGITTTKSTITLRNFWARSIAEGFICELRKKNKNKNKNNEHATEIHNCKDIREKNNQR